MKNALVSVVIPVYKCTPRFLHRSLSSILSQTYDDLEIILIVDLINGNDQSSVTETLEAFKDDHRIRTLMRKGRRGYCRALNDGILRSSGDFIARLDSDDYSDTTRLESQVDALRSGKVSLVGSWAKVIDEQDREIGRIKTPETEKSIRNRIMFHNPFVHSSIISKKSVFKEVGPYNDAFEGAEDYELYLRIVSRGFQCRNVPLFLTYLRETTDSMTRGPNWRRTRASYLRAKAEAVIRLRYNRGLDLLFAICSPAALMITPWMGLHLKRAVRWFV